MAQKPQQPLVEARTGDQSQRETRVLRLAAVKNRTGVSRSSIYAWVAAGTFPRPISLGPRAVGWLESEIAEWLQRRIEASRKPGVS